MAKFLDTTGISYHLQQLINNSNDKLYLICPYLKINKRIKQALEDKEKFKLDIRIIYGKTDLSPEESEWLNTTSIRLEFCKDLHAKCYLSENEAIITSMNLHEFSQVNNVEMGILIDKTQDAELYENLFKEVERIMRGSEGRSITIEKVEKSNKTKKVKIEVDNGKNLGHVGYCIRTGEEIKFNPERPFSYQAFKSWAKYEEEEYPEEYCHFSGEQSKGKTSMAKPILHKNWSKAKKYAKDHGIEIE